MEDFQKCRHCIDAAISAIQELTFFALERKMLYEQETFVRVQRKQHEQVIRMHELGRYMHTRLRAHTALEPAPYPCYIHDSVYVE